MRDYVRSISTLSSPLAVVACAACLCLATPASGQSTHEGEPNASDETVSDSTDETASASEPSLRVRLERLLSGYHYTPDREVLDEVANPERVRAELRSIARDDGLRPSMRLRAVDTLALYDDAETVSFLRNLLSGAEERANADDEDREEGRVANLMRHHAITSLARNRSDERAVELLEGFLESDDLQIRLTAIAALGQHAGEPGRKRLRRLAAKVEDEVVRSALARHVDLESASSANDDASSER